MARLWWWSRVLVELVFAAATGRVDGSPHHSVKPGRGAVQTLNTGSLAWAVALAGAYSYMVLSWGGYTFIINLLPIHCLVCVFSGRLTTNLYIAYAPITVFGTLAAASVPVVGFNAVTTSEHYGSFLAFGVLHVALAIKFAKRVLPERDFRLAKAAVFAGGGGAAAVVGVAVVLKMLASPTFGWTGRSLSLLDPTYASKYIPIIASVSEHQPPAWNSYFMDIHVMVMLMPLGFIYCFRPLTDAKLFLVLYGVTAVYFSGVMVRLMLVLAPAACCLAAIGASELLAACSAALVSDRRAVASSPCALPPCVALPSAACSALCSPTRTMLWSKRRSRCQGHATKHAYHAGSNFDMSWSPLLPRPSNPSQCLSSFASRRLKPLQCLSSCAGRRRRRRRAKSPQSSPATRPPSRGPS